MNNIGHFKPIERANANTTNTTYKKLKTKASLVGCSVTLTNPMALLVRINIRFETQFRPALQRGWSSDDNLSSGTELFEDFGIL